MTFCDHCLLKNGICPHLKELMKESLKHTGIDGAKLCPLLLAAANSKEETPKCKQSLKI